MHIRSILLVCCLALCLHSTAQTPLNTLRRRADWGARLGVADPGPGALVRSTVLGGAADKAGLKAGDRIVLLNGYSLPTPNSFYNRVRALRGGDAVQLVVQRGNNSHTIELLLPAMTRETYDKADLEVSEVLTSYGHKLRTYLTKPKGIARRQPAILFVSWLSCSSVETPNGAQSGTERWLREVAEQSGCILLRIEKPGVGDSEGTPCADCDLHTELAGYRAGLAHLRARADVDTNNIIVMGESLGGSLGPVVAQGNHVRGFVSVMSVFKTWHEHMLEIERRRMRLSGTDVASITCNMRAYSEFYVDYLIRGLTPEQAIRQKPHLAPAWYDDATGQYGRPASFYQQLNNLDILGSWAQVQAPVLLVAGEYDWIMTHEDHYLVADMLNAKQAGLATVQVIKGMNHFLDVYANQQDAFDERNGRYATELTPVVVSWIRALVKKP